MAGISRWSAAAAFSVVVASSTAAQAPGGPASPAPAPPQIVTSGTGEVRIAPDRASISIGVQTRAQTAADASNQNSRKQRAIIDAIRAKGVPADQIGTSGFNVNPEMRYPQNAAPVLTGYVVTNTVTVDLSKTDLVGAVIDAAINAGANQVNSLSFSIANPDSARRVALATAVARAKGDAEAVARAAGGSLGALVELTAAEFDAPVFKPMFSRAGVTSMSAEAAIEPGLQPVRASVTVRWQFVSGGR